MIVLFGIRKVLSCDLLIAFVDLVVPTDVCLCQSYYVEFKFVDVVVNLFNCVCTIISSVNVLECEANGVWMFCMYGRYVTPMVVVVGIDVLLLRT